MEAKKLKEEQLEQLLDKKKKLILELDKYEYETSQYVDCEKKISEIEEQIENLCEENREFDDEMLSELNIKGSRENPYVPGDLIQLDEELEMTIEWITRGERAYRLLKENEPSVEKPRNMEYVYISALIKNVGKDRMIITGSRFSIVKGDGVESEELVSMGEHFCPMHAGAVQKANIHFKVDKSEKKPMLYYSYYGDGVWISLDLYETDELIKKDENVLQRKQHNEKKDAPKNKIESSHNNNGYVDMCRIGLEAYNRGEVDKAKKMLKQAALSGDLRAYEILGDIHMNNNNIEAAIICFEKAKSGGIETAAYKLEMANAKKTMINFFEKKTNSSNDENKYENVTSQKSNKTTKDVTEEKNNEDINNVYIFNENKKQARKKLILYAVGVILCGSITFELFNKSEVLEAFIFLLVTLGIAQVGINAYNRKCPKCGKLDAMVTISSKITGEKKINKIKRANDYDSKGYKIGEHEQYVSGVRTFTHDIDQCKYCKYKKMVNRSNDSI